MELPGRKPRGGHGRAAAVPTESSRPPSPVTGTFPGRLLRRGCPAGRRRSRHNPCRPRRGEARPRRARGAPGAPPPLPGTPPEQRPPPGHRLRRARPRRPARRPLPAAPPPRGAHGGDASALSSHSPVPPAPDFSGNHPRTTRPLLPAVPRGAGAALPASPGRPARTLQLAAVAGCPGLPSVPSRGRRLSPAEVPARAPPAQAPPFSSTGRVGEPVPVPATASLPPPPPGGRAAAPPHLASSRPRLRRARGPSGRQGGKEGGEGRGGKEGKGREEGREGGRERPPPPRSPPPPARSHGESPRALRRPPTRGRRVTQRPAGAAPAAAAPPSGRSARGRGRDPPRGNCADPHGPASGKQHGNRAEPPCRAGHTAPGAAEGAERAGLGCDTQKPVRKCPVSIGARRNGSV
ncbi:basic salivary proline-rich protein 3-like [Molothrus aeneus]|uniref:basic salivary proline-rich protein 3-like n=1 Tax=Molothrus aeneus TaxID=84833 RepID=UPI00345A16B2